MRIQTLKLVDYRNYQSVSISLGERFNLFFGRNAQGKTNLLEALSLFGSLKSFRTTKLKDLVRHGADGAVLRSEAISRELDFQIVLGLQNGAKTLKVNGKAVSRASAYYGTLNFVVFTPDDLELAKGFPNVRRRLMDRAIFQTRPVHAERSIEYQHILKQRNHLLRNGGDDSELFDVYTEQLAARGAQIVARRAHFVDGLKKVLGRVVERISGVGEIAKCHYRCSAGDPASWDEENIQAALLKKLRAGRDQERRLGYSIAGPHRDDLLFFVNGKPLKDFGSQGQQRTFVLAIKIAESEYLKEQSGVYPILLLDDLSSELDDARRGFLFNYLLQCGGQVVLTSTEPELPGAFQRDHCKRFRVEEGTVREEPWT